MKILALDLSTRSSGWFITKSSCGIIKTDEKMSFEEKLVYFRQQLVQLLEKYNPDLLILEDSYYQPRRGSIHTLKALCKFAGVAIETCAARKIPVEIITATAARKHCCGKSEGKVSKEDVFKYFVEKYDLKDWTFSSHNDITDAMALLWGYRGKKRAEKK